MLSGNGQVQAWEVENVQSQGNLVINNTNDTKDCARVIYLIALLCVLVSAEIVWLVKEVLDERPATAMGSTLVGWNLSLWCVATRRQLLIVLGRQRHMITEIAWCIAFIGFPAYVGAAFGVGQIVWPTFVASYALWVSCVIPDINIHCRNASMG